MMQCGADVHLVDRYMPYPDGHALQKMLEPILCIFIDGDINEALKQLERYSKNFSCSQRNRQITDELILLGFRMNTRGARQMHTALSMILHDERKLSNLEDDVYTVISQEYNTSASCVERNLRYTIERVWTRGNLQVLQERFGYTIDAERGKPTNKAFLAQIAEHIRLHCA